MSKCVITGKETLSLTKNVPLSREGRQILKEKHQEYNSTLKTKFIEEQKELGTNLGTDEYLAKIAPKISKGLFLKTVANSSLEEVFSTLEKKSESKES